MSAVDHENSSEVQDTLTFDGATGYHPAPEYAYALQPHAFIEEVFDSRTWSISKRSHNIIKSRRFSCPKDDGDVVENIGEAMSRRSAVAKAVSFTLAEL